MKSKLSITLNSKTIKAIDNIVDNLYIRNRSQAIEHLVEHALGENKIAVIISGGEEENLKVSKNEFRPTAKIAGSSVIEIAIKKLRESGFREIYIIARHLVLRDIFQLLGDGSKFGVKINYTKEEKSNGSAESLRLLKGKIKTSFLVTFSDIIFDKINLNKLWEIHLKQKAISTLMAVSSPATLEKAGILKIEGNKIIEFIEKPSSKKIGSSIFFGGIFISEPEILEYQGDSLEKNVFPELAKKGFLYSYINSAPYFHFHTKEELKKIESELKTL